MPYEINDHNAVPFAVFTPDDRPADRGAITQMIECLAHGDAVGGSLSADHHLGYSAPIGASIAYENYVSPSAVGYDIGCGNKAVATSLLYSDIRKDLPRIMDEINRRIAFGVGQPNEEAVEDHPVYDRIARFNDLPWIKAMLGLAQKQLGTVGAGNHYVDLFREAGTDRVWVGVHFGSRGFGHKIASGFLALAEGKRHDERATEGEMHSPPVLLDVRGPLGYMYIEAMELAGAYAYAGRNVVVDKVLEILYGERCTTATYDKWVFHTVHNHHNFTWQESDAWVARKGATPLFPGQQGFVGASMAEDAVIIEGAPVIGPGTTTVGLASLFSAPHGAGRAMSRTEAAGKARKRWHCTACGWTQGPGVQSPVHGHADKNDAACPSCRFVGALGKKWVQEKEGKVDWQAALADIDRKGIQLRGGAADEAPAAYKRLPAVLAAHAPYVQVKHRLIPIGVCMAGSGTHDPYKD